MTGAVFLSAGIPDPKRSPLYAETADTVAITAAVAALIHVVLGRRPLVWGGHPAITPMIWTVAQDLDVDYSSWVQLYQSRYFEDEFPEDNTRFRNVHYVDAGPDQESSLRRMRKRMLRRHSFQAGVFIGGMDGILREYAMLSRIQPDAAIVPLMTTGAAALDLGMQLGTSNPEFTQNLDYVAVFHRALNISVREQRYRTPADQPASVEERYWNRPPSKKDQ